MSRKNIITVERAEVEFRLKSGIKELGILLDDIQLGKLVDFLFLLGKWNSTYNLTAIRDIYSMLTYHLLDSLSVAACLRPVRIFLMWDPVPVCQDWFLRRFIRTREYP